MELTDAHPPPRAVLPLTQSPQFAAALCAMGRRAEVLTLRAGAQRVGSVALIARRVPGLGHVRFTSRGPVWAPGATLRLRQQAIACLRRERVILANAGPGDEALFATMGFVRVAHAATVAELDLTTPGGWRGAARGSWRRALTHAERRAAAVGIDLVTRPFDPGGVDADTLQICARQARRRGYRDLPPAFTLAFARANPTAAQIFIARLRGDPIAAVVVLRHHGAATYHLGWTSDAGRRLEAHRLLLARAADWLVERGKTRFDLGTIDTVTTPGLARFKLGMGAGAVHLGGTWLRRPGPTLADRLRGSAWMPAHPHAQPPPP